MPLSTYRRMSLPLRTALVMPLCALAVHQLRYYLVFGVRAPARLEREGHAYLGIVVPFAVLLAAMAVGVLVGAAARAWNDRGRGVPARRAGVRTWILCSCALLFLYCGQELAEGFLAAGHPSGIAGILGHGGFAAAPVSLLVAGLLALGLRAADTVIGLAAKRVRPPRTTSEAPLLASFTLRLTPDWRLAPRSGVAAGRAPPPALGP